MGYKGKKNNNYKKKGDRKHTSDTKLTEMREQRIGALDAEKSNDISWYNKSTNFYNDATRLPFNRILGDEIGNPYSGTDIMDIGLDAIPGVMSIDYIPVPGVTTGSNDPINRAFQDLYASIYAKTTGAMQFQQMELSMFLTGMASLVANIAMVKRAVEHSYLWASQNYYMPKALLIAMGIDPASVIDKQDQVRMKINNAIRSFNRLRIPKFVDAFARAYSIAHNVYSDGEGLNTSQYYVFRPAGYYIYRGTLVNPDESVGGLAWRKFDLLLNTDTNIYTRDIDYYIDVINEQITAFRSDANLGLILGSIQRAFSDAQLMSVEELSSTTISAPVHDRNMTWQINNLRTVEIDPSNSNGTLNIYQNVLENSLIFQPKLSIDESTQQSTTNPSFYYLHSTDGSKDPEFVMESTRLMPTVGVKDGVTVVTSCGLELPISMSLYFNHRDDATSDVVTYAIPFSTNIYVVGNGELSGFWKWDAKLFSKFITKYSKFKNAPMLNLFTRFSITGEDTTYCGVHGDFSTYTTIDNSALSGLHEAAQQSLYFIEGVQIR